MHVFVDGALILLTEAQRKDCSDKLESDPAAQGSLGNSPDSTPPVQGSLHGLPDCGPAPLVVLALRLGSDTISLVFVFTAMVLVTGSL